MSGTRATSSFGTSQFKKQTGTFKPYDHTFSLGLAHTSYFFLAMTTVCPCWLRGSPHPLLWAAIQRRGRHHDFTLRWTPLNSVVTIYQSWVHHVFTRCPTWGWWWQLSWDLAQSVSCSVWYRHGYRHVFTSSNLWVLRKHQCHSAIQYLLRGCWQVQESPRAYLTKSLTFASNNRIHKFQATYLAG